MIELGKVSSRIELGKYHVDNRLKVEFLNLVMLLIKWRTDEILDKLPTNTCPQDGSMIAKNFGISTGLVQTI
jgi:hypothetical protein